MRGYFISFSIICNDLKNQSKLSHDFLNTLYFCNFLNNSISNLLFSSSTSLQNFSWKYIALYS
ncbi:MAG: hypothetical protein Q8S84_06050 [bacterium]|nr:hypothetical protein [bacterium]MDP3381041.1 hypothetical protein [bacterium]